MNEKLALIGKKVKPRLGASGTIVKEYVDAVEVAYPDKTVQVPFSSFKNGYVKAEDEEIQNQILIALKQQEALKQSQEHIQQVEQTQGVSNTTISTKSRKHRNVYFVFQGKEYLKELKQWYLWAAHTTPTGGEAPHHWRRLAQLKPGDIVFHGVAQAVLAVSIVTSESYSWQRPDQDRLGWRVDCQGCILKNPVFIQAYHREIVEYCSALPYQPFNKHGKGNQGYLFDISRRLAKLFLKDIVENNPKIFDCLKDFQMVLEEI